MQILFPTTERSLEQILTQLAKETVCEPFNEVVVKFVGALANVILLHKEMRQYHEFMAVADWMRLANVLVLKAELQKLQGTRLLMPQGIVLHFAPANVDTIFIYSWIISLLVGNINIIRVSQNISAATRLFFAILNDVLQQEAFATIANRLLILTYEHDDAISATLSNCCNVRVIWGGDNTIRNIRKVPLPVRANEIVFADRFSYAVIVASQMLHIPDEELSAIAKAFYQDAFTFNQKACSSPRAIVWVGDSTTILKAKERFWSNVEAYAQDKKLWQGIETAVAMLRLTAVFRYAALNKINTVKNSLFNFPCRLTIKNIDEVTKDIHPGVGLFLEIEKQSLNELADVFTAKDQTLMVFGCSQAEIIKLLQLVPFGALDRIVPFGSALKFSHVWDGYNLLLAFTREVAVNV